MNRDEYTFATTIKGKSQFMGGSYDPKSRSPKYELEVIGPEAAKKLVELKPFQMGRGNNVNWGWDINNNYDGQVFFNMTVDGRPARPPR